MVKTKKRPYTSLVRQRQAGDTRRRIVEATRQLLETEGYAGMTIEAIARRAEVSAQSVYAIFKSKAGILAELLDQSSFGPRYQELVQQALSTNDPEARLRLAARIARQIHETQDATFDLLRGAGVVAPALAQLEQRRECVRYDRQESTAIVLRDSGRLRLDYQSARDLFWMFTSRDIFRMLVRERGWSPQQYETWLANTLVQTLMKPKPSHASRHRKVRL
ncbi:MAG: TetR/AcrR family transcriptional regulator [Acidobacteria bacterium]|nr:MAG: TetR/AcrR family transcriptional regulator [Acidobacteriota bacterium]